VSEGAHGGEGGGLLSSTGAGTGDEEAGVLAVEAAGLPLTAGAVPEGLDVSVLQIEVDWTVRACTFHWAGIFP
jgi:hypothetical protein